MDPKVTAGPGATRETTMWLVLLGLLVFFGRWSISGLQPDAALYAGLSKKILLTGERWLLSGSSNYFPMYYEHPPFVMQWGALVLKLLGTSDGAARAIGGIPGALGFFAMVFWTSLRFGRRCALWTAFALVTCGLYTKYAATAMLEGPLSLGVALAAIGTFEVLWGTRARSSLPSLALFAGLMIATASKGVAGLGAWGGFALTAMSALAWGCVAVERRRSLVWILLLSLPFAVLPLVWWIAEMTQRNGLDWIAGYFVNQVFTSAVSTRGDASHAGGGSVFFFARILVTQAGPWVAAVALAALGVRLAKREGPRPAWSVAFANPALGQYLVVFTAFFVAFFVPFSLSKFQLAHYIHPAYLVGAPLAGYALMALLPLWKPFASLQSNAAGLRWTGLVALAIVLLSGVTAPGAEANRGQAFAGGALALQLYPADCVVVAPQFDIDEYRVEAYTLWYWSIDRRVQIVSDDVYRAALAALDQGESRWIFWNVKGGTFAPSRACRP